MIIFDQFNIERLVRGSRGQLDQSVMVCHLRPVLLSLDFFLRQKKNIQGLKTVTGVAPSI